MSAVRAALSITTVNSRDASALDLNEMTRALFEEGWDTRVFAEFFGGTAGPGPHHSRYVEDFVNAPEDLFILHYAQKCPLGLKQLKRLRCRRVLRFHNVTPPALFGALDPHVALDCQKSLEEMGREFRFLDSVLFLPASEFSRRDLLAVGVPESRCEVVPVFHDLERLVSANEDVALSRRMTGDGVPNIVTVGRLTPHKGQHRMIEAMRILDESRKGGCRLWIAGGGDRGEAYRKQLEGMIERWGLEGCVKLMGSVSNAQLATLYRRADLFALPSSHEGFCVPLVEAMAHGVPSVVLNAGALAETQGDTGELLESGDPSRIAEAIRGLLDDPFRRETLGKACLRRYSEKFAEDRVRARFMGLVGQTSEFHPAKSKALHAAPGP